MHKDIKALLFSTYAVGCYLLCVLIPTYLDPIIASYWTDEFRSSVFQHKTIFISQGYTYGYELGYNVSLFSILLFLFAFLLYNSKIGTRWKMIGIFLSFVAFNSLAMLLHFKCIHAWVFLTMILLGGLLVVITAIDEIIKLGLLKTEAGISLIIAICVFFTMQLATITYNLFKGQIEACMLSHLANTLIVCYALVLIYGIIGIIIGVIYPFLKRKK